LKLYFHIQLTDFFGFVSKANVANKKSLRLEGFCLFINVFLYSKVFVYLPLCFILSGYSLTFCIRKARFKLTK